MKIRILIIFILLISGGMLKISLEKEKRKLGEFDYKFIFEGIKKNYIDAVDIIFILMNRPRFKADINWINFIQKADSINKSVNFKTSNYFMKTVYADPYFHEAKVYGGYIYTISVAESSESLFKDMLRITNSLAPNSMYLRHLTFLYLMNYNPTISNEETSLIEKEILTPESSIQYYKYSGRC